MFKPADWIFGIDESTPELATQIAQRTQRLSPWGQRNVHGLLARLEAASVS